MLNPDLPVAYRDLLGREPWSVRRLTYSPVVLSCCSPARRRTYTKIAHHNIHFGRSWEGVFDELHRPRQLMSDPSILVTNPTRSDPSLAPDGKQIYYVLFPTPNLDAPIDWRVEAPRYRDQVVSRARGARLRRLRRRHRGGARDHAARLGGTRHGARARRSPPRTRSSRPGRSGRATCWGENVVFTGSGTQPGVGVPMVLVSGRLAAERIVGPLPRSLSR